LKGVDLRLSNAISMMRGVRRRTIAGWIAGILTAGTAAAENFVPPAPGLPIDAIDAVRFYVGDQETYDDNLFRVPPGTAGVPGAVFRNPSQGDEANTATVGGLGKWGIGQQEVELDVHGDENRFEHNQVLNYVSGDAQGTWDWHLGQFLSGQVQAVYDRALASFSETRFSGKDVVTSVQELAYGRYQLGPHWAVYGQVHGSYIDHSALSQQYDDFHNNGGYAGVEYATNVDDTFAFEYRYVDVTFRPDVGAAVGAYNYREDTYKFVAKYAVTDKTQISGYAGYLQRKYPGSDVTGLGIDSYSGDVWRVNGGWAATDKTSVNVSVWHELNAYIDAESNYFVAEGESIGPTWNVTEKVNLTLLAAYEKQNYIANSSIVVTSGTAREDKVDYAQLTVRYQPRDRWILIAFLRHDKRESNQYVFSFNDNVASASLTYSFW